MPDSLFKPERIPYQAGNINGSTELLGLIGGSIKDSLSPLIHNASISYLQKNSIYLPFNFRSDNLPGLLETCKHLRIRHLNVTAPFKTKIMSYIEAAPNLPSINTLTYNDSVNNFIGHSTDGAGFCRGLSTIDRTIADYDDIIFLGYGGAAKAILAHLATLPSAGSQHITLLNKSPISKDTAIKHNKRFRKTYIGELTFQEVSSAVTLGNPSQLIVQATSGPLKGDDLRWLTPGPETSQRHLLRVKLRKDIACPYATKGKWIDLPGRNPYVNRTGIAVSRILVGKSADRAYINSVVYGTLSKPLK